MLLFVSFSFLYVLEPPKVRRNCHAFRRFPRPTPCSKWNEKRLGTRNFWSTGFWSIDWSEESIFLVGWNSVANFQNYCISLPSKFNFNTWNLICWQDKQIDKLTITKQTEQDNFSARSPTSTDSHNIKISPSTISQILVPSSQRK